MSVVKAAGPILNFNKMLNSFINLFSPLARQLFKLSPPGVVALASNTMREGEDNEFAFQTMRHATRHKNAVPLTKA